MPSHENDYGQWRGWWEGVVDLVPIGGGSRAFSMRSLFKKDILKPFPEADSSLIRLVMPEGAKLARDPAPSQISGRWLDGRWREVAEWDLLDKSLHALDLRFWWEHEGDFAYRKPPRS